MKYIVILVLALIASFGITALIVKGVCWAFGLAFSLKIAFGVWLILILARGIFGNSHRD